MSRRCSPALEYASFATFGVGLWQARLVSQLAGVAAVLLLGLGIAASPAAPRAWPPPRCSPPTTSR